MFQSILKACYFGYFIWHYISMFFPHFNCLSIVSPRKLKSSTQSTCILYSPNAHNIRVIGMYYLHIMHALPYPLWLFLKPHFNFSRRFSWVISCCPIIFKVLQNVQCRWKWIYTCIKLPSFSLAKSTFGEVFCQFVASPDSFNHAHRKNC